MATKQTESGTKSIKKENIEIQNTVKKKKKENVDLFKTNRMKDAWKDLKTLCADETKQNMQEPKNITLYVSEMNSFIPRFKRNDVFEACNDMRETTSKRDERSI